MTKEKYIEVLHANPHADELMRMGFNTAVQMLAIRDEDITKEDMFSILEVIREDER